MWCEINSWTTILSHARRTFSDVGKRQWHVHILSATVMRVLCGWTQYELKWELANGHCECRWFFSCVFWKARNNIRGSSTFRFPISNRISHTFRSAENRKRKSGVGYRGIVHPPVRKVQDEFGEWDFGPLPAYRSYTETTQSVSKSPFFHFHSV